MTIHSISSTNLWQLLEAAQTNSVSNVSSTTSSNGSSSVTSTSGDSSTLSKPGQLFSELKLLSRTNPTEFKKITSQIANQLQQAATNATEPNQANALQQLATNFQTASQSGNFSDLFPQSSNSSTGSDAAGQISSAGGYHHHHYGSSEASAGSSNQSTSDPVSSVFANALTQIQTDLA